MEKRGMSVLRAGTLSLLLLVLLAVFLCIRLDGQERPPAQTPATGKDRPGFASREKLADKSLKDYGKDCLRSGCHGQLKDAAWLHGPVAVGSCDGCHESDASAPGHRFKLVRPRETLCSFCHKQPAAQTVVHKPYGDGDCTACHDPHGAKTKSLLVGDSTAALCDKCHDREISTPSGGRLANIKQELASKAFKHGPVEKGDCGACHVSHGGPYPRLLAKSYTSEFYADYIEGAYDLCFTCHDRKLVTDERTNVTNFRDGDRNLHYVHVHRKKGRTCAVCHEAHSGAKKELVREAVAFGPEGWKLPIDLSKTETGGSCGTGCHKKLSYSNVNPPKPEPMEQKPASEVKK